MNESRIAMLKDLTNCAIGLAVLCFLIPLVISTIALDDLSSPEPTFTKTVQLGTCAFADPKPSNIHYVTPAVNDLFVYSFVCAIASCIAAVVLKGLSVWFEE